MTRSEARDVCTSSSRVLLAPSMNSSEDRFAPSMAPRSSSAFAPDASAVDFFIVEAISAPTSSSSLSLLSNSIR